MDTFSAPPVGSPRSAWAEYYRRLADHYTAAAQRVRDDGDPEYGELLEEVATEATASAERFEL